MKRCRCSPSGGNRSSGRPNGHCSNDCSSPVRRRPIGGPPTDCHCLCGERSLSLCRHAEITLGSFSPARRVFFWELHAMSNATTIERVILGPEHTAQQSQHYALTGRTDAEAVRIGPGRRKYSVPPDGRCSRGDHIRARANNRESGGGIGFPARIPRPRLRARSDIEPSLMDHRRIIGRPRFSAADRVAAGGRPACRPDSVHTHSTEGTSHDHARFLERGHQPRRVHHDQVR